MREGAGLAIGAVAIVTAVVLLANQVPDAQLGTGVAAPSGAVIISEVVSSNASVLADEDGDFSDWIELYNPGEEPIDLGGHHLSDDAEEPARWTVPDGVTIPGGDRLLVWASGKDRGEADGELHTDFAIAQDGEPLTLVTPTADEVVDRLDPVEIPRNASFGRQADDLSRSCFFERPAPGEDNVGECHAAAPTDAPQLSVPGGFHADELDLSLHVPVDLDIYYTLDGSYPDPVDNPERTHTFEGPIEITDRTSEPDRFTDIRTTVPDPPQAPFIEEFEGPDEPVQKATVVRARTPFSEETSATYFVGQDLVRDQLPVVSIATDPEHLFDEATGIYVPGDTYTQWLESDDYDPDAAWADVPANFHQRGRDWERPAPDESHRHSVFTYCDPVDGCVHTNEVGLRVHGGISRTYPLKSLRLYARNAYGERTFDHPFFGEDGLGSHRRLLLRNSGNDWNQTMLLDGFVQSLTTHMDVETQDYQPTVVFLNGEYWGVLNLRERHDPHYLEAAHAIDPDDVIMLTRDDFDWAVGAGEVGDEQPYLDLLAFVDEHDLSDPDAFAHVEERMDLDDLLDYLFIEIYSGNRDWPGNNTDLWRLDVEPDPSIDGPRDGRWRWLVYDLDQLGDNSMDPRDRTLERVTIDPGTDPVNTFGVPLLVSNLLDNADFERRFLTHAADHINTTFEPTRARTELDALAELLEPEMERHVERWPGPLSMDHWRNNVDLLGTFMRVRPGEFRRQLVERFELDGTVPVHVRSSQGGTVRINDVLLDPSTPGVTDPSDWRGVYFRGVPVTFEAVADEGYRFVGWEGLGPTTRTATTTSVTPDGPSRLQVEAGFEPA